MSSRHAVSEDAVLVGVGAHGHQIKADYGFAHPLISVLFYAERSAFQFSHVFHPCFVSIHVSVIMAVVMKPCAIGLQYILSAGTILRASREEMRKGRQIPYCKLVVRVVQGADKQVRSNIINIVRIDLFTDFLCA